MVASVFVSQPLEKITQPLTLFEQAIKVLGSSVLKLKPALVSFSEDYHLVALSIYGSIRSAIASP